MRIFSAFLNIPDIQIKLVILTIPILFYIHRFQIFLPLIPFTLAYLLSAICYIVTMDMKKIEGTVFLENYTEMENLYTCDAHSHGMKFGDSGSSKRRRCLNRGVGVLSSGRLLDLAPLFLHDSRSDRVL